MTVIVATVGVLVAATLAGWLLTRRSGRIREIDFKAEQNTDADVATLGLSRSGPTVVHFSAPWCGPCDRVRRVVEQVCDDLSDVAHVEVDLDANPETGRRYSILSLPTTLIFDTHGRQRYRTSGVPNAADLRSALKPLLA
jgi:thiol-disulfide isomerase/thioredoxin